MGTMAMMKLQAAWCTNELAIVILRLELGIDDQGSKCGLMQSIMDNGHLTQIEWNDARAQHIFRAITVGEELG